MLIGAVVPVYFAPPPPEFPVAAQLVDSVAHSPRLSHHPPGLHPSSFRCLLLMHRFPALRNLASIYIAGIALAAFGHASSNNALLGFVAAVPSPRRANMTSPQRLSLIHI